MIENVLILFFANNSDDRCKHFWILIVDAPTRVFDLIQLCVGFQRRNYMHCKLDHNYLQFT